MFGPIEGRRHDAFMLGASGLLPKLQQFNQPNGQPYVIYGDPAYGISRNIIAPYRGAHLTQQQQDFNKSRSQVRISVEWTFGKICQYFSYLDFKRNTKVLLQPVGKFYLVAALMTNCHTCLYWSLTGTFFGLDPPSLEVYLLNWTFHFASCSVYHGTNGRQDWELHMARKEGGNGKTAANQTSAITIDLELSSG